jgi:hypothetical protein
MILDVSEDRSAYELSIDEKNKLIHFFDEVLLASEPEDMSDEIVITNLVEEEKWKSSPGGMKNSFKKRHTYPDFVDFSDLSTHRISGQDIIETNPEKGIYFDNSNSKTPGTYYTRYTVGLRAQSILHERYNGVIRIDSIPPHIRDDNYLFDISLRIHDGLADDEIDDMSHYVLLNDSSEIKSEISTYPKEVKRGRLMFRPLSGEDPDYNSLSFHAKLISNVLGIDCPDFLDSNN